MSLFGDFDLWLGSATPTATPGDAISEQILLWLTAGRDEGLLLLLVGDAYVPNAWVDGAAARAYAEKFRDAIDPLQRYDQVGNAIISLSQQYERNMGRRGPGPQPYR